MKVYQVTNKKTKHTHEIMNEDVIKTLRKDNNYVVKEAKKKNDAESSADEE